MIPSTKEEGPTATGAPPRIVDFFGPCRRLRNRRCWPSACKGAKKQHKSVYHAPGRSVNARNPRPALRFAFPGHRRLPQVGHPAGQRRGGEEGRNDRRCGNDEGSALGREPTSHQMLRRPGFVDELLVDIGAGHSRTSSTATISVTARD